MNVSPVHAEMVLSDGQASLTLCTGSVSGPVVVESGCGEYFGKGGFAMTLDSGLALAAGLPVCQGG